MIGGLEAALIGGLLMIGGVVGLIWYLIPNQIALSAALERLSPEHARGVLRKRSDSQREAIAIDTESGLDRLGGWAFRRLPSALWWRTPSADLEILRISAQQFYGKKLAYAALGLVIVPMLTFIFSMAGLMLPVVIPAFASLLLAGFMFELPAIEVRDQAKNARFEFGRALSAYIDLVALERNAGSGPRQALELAADTCEHWVFQRIGEELRRSRWSGVAPWDALEGLSRELSLPQLADLGDIMRLAGEDGASVYRQLRARSAAIRNAELNRELALAGETGERMSIPMSLLGVVFLAILTGPAILRMLSG